MKKRMTSRLMMKNANPFLLSAWIILVFSWLLNSASATAEIIYEYDFEPGWDNWSVDNGVWEIGTPPPEITTCHGGAQCAGTVLGGDYPGDTDSRLISPSITLPVVTRNEEIHLRFWQWFWYSVNDAGYVQISVYDEETKTWSGWWTIGNSVYDNTYAWSLMAVDLTDYAGEKVRIAFYHTAYSWPWGECGPGWYVDDIEIVRKVPGFSGDFESGWGDWSADRGVWEVGTPTVGPTECHGGAQCAGTILGGDYPGDTDSRLISPSITLPVVTEDEEIHLRFWQWFSYSVNDAGYVQISVYDEGTQTWSAWADRDSVSGVSSIWSPKDVDLTDYAGEKVRIAFYHTAYSWPWGECGPGWYVDDIDLTGIPECTDGDGDGYNIEGGGCGAIDCDDDPSDDAEQCPSQGGACVCGEPDCGLCAECVNPGAEEICGDDIDNDCDGAIDPNWPCEVTAAASTGHGLENVGESSVLNNLMFVLFSVGTVITLRILRRKR